MWHYVRQINNFIRVEDRSGAKPRVVCFTESEADAKMICEAVNKSGLKIEMFMKPKQQTKQAAAG